MTLRASKPSFNVREKLNQLERPIGVKGNELMRAETAQDARDLVSAGRKNLVINGAMQVAQRGTSQSGLADSPEFVVDRFAYRRSGSWGTNSFTMGQQSSGAPDGFKYFLRLAQSGTAAAPPGNTDCRIGVYLEGNTISQASFGKSAAQPVTLSFYARASIAGTYCVSLGDGIGQTYLEEYSVTTSWQRFIVNIPPRTTGNWNTDTSTGFYFHWIVAADSDGTNSGSTGWTATNARYTTNQLETFASTSGATFDLTGVQLEVGKNATEFEHRSYGEELSLCQRYYYRVYGGRYEWRSSDYTTYRNGSLGSGSHPVTMRQSPTMGHNLTGDSTNTNPSNAASPVGAWSWYSWATGWGTSSSINSGTIANWGLDSTTNGWSGGIYYLSPSNYSHVTHMQISAQSYIELNAEL